MKRALVIWLEVLKTSLKLMIGYRTQALVQSLFVIMYVIMLYIIMRVIFLHTDFLGGWSRSEAMLLFGIVNLLSLFAATLFYDSYQHFVNKGIREGHLDLVLTKPISSRFWVSISRPQVASILSLAFVAMYVFHLLITEVYSISVESILLSLVATFFSCIIMYNTITICACFAFYSTNSRQSIDILYKLLDYGQYPVTMFPTSIRLISFTIVPIAFFGYVTTALLLKKESYLLLVVTIIVAIISWYLSQAFWQKGLKRYESVSR